MPRTPDLGTVLDVAGTDLTTSYSYGSAQDIGGCSVVRCSVAVTGKSATSVTGTSVKMQGSYDGTNFTDVATVMDSTGTTELEHSQNPTASTTLYYSFHGDPRLFKGGVRFCVKIAGTAGTGDEVLVKAEAW